MSSPPPNEPRQEDEVLSFLERFERLLWRLIEGIVEFLGKRLPNWIYESVKYLLADFTEYFDWAIRVFKRIGKIACYGMILLLLVVGPLILFSQCGRVGPVLSLAWLVLIALALVYAFQRYLRKELQRQKQVRQAASGGMLVCRNCNTAHDGALVPDKCKYCGNVWIS
jgi:hypothetical protein